MTARITRRTTERRCSAARGGFEKLAVGVFGVGLLGAPYVARAGATPVIVTSHLPQQNLVADGMTIYQMNVRVDSTAELEATDWDVFVPDRFTTILTSPHEPQIPTENDYFEGVPMDPAWNFVDTTPQPAAGGEIFTANARLVDGNFGVAGSGDLENLYFVVNLGAPYGPVGSCSCSLDNCQACPDNFRIIGIDFVDPQGTQYKVSNGNLTRVSDPFTIFEVGDMDFDGSVDGRDIRHFVGALMDPLGYQEARSAGTIGSGDMNLDGILDAADIPYFVDRLTDNTP